MWNVVKKIGSGIGIICTPIAFCDLIGHPAAVVGSSMEPTLHGTGSRWWQNDIIWLSKWYAHPKPGEIFTFISPQDPTVQHIKRVSKVPGEKVIVKEGKSAILGVCDYWMLSDNASAGKDSRVYGPVNIGLFQGKAMFILWPPNRIGRMKQKE
uniref:Mitochondrial inner membrane protease subunit 2 n=1 Tax=Panagrolaimus sp. JU765 TaxID=591449 RepID=A0AC34QC96_9BILA